jgi:ABC-type sugar transport system ATPase subunit
MTVEVSGDPDLVLDMSDVGMRFGDEWVLRHVDFAVRRGTIHALVGHNGAGKSTLMKIALGGQAPTEGVVRINGQPLTFSRPAESRQLGLGMVLQERSLIRTLNGLDNIFLNAERVNRARIVRRGAEEREAAELCHRLGVSRSILRKTIGEMSPVQQELVEIAKALRLASAVLVLDEPTAPLAEREIEILFRAMRNVAESGTGIVLITHHLAEVFAISDQVTTLREGKVTLSAPTSSTSMSPLIEAMLGKQLLETEREIASESLADSDAAGNAPRPVPALEVSALGVAPKLHDVSFSLYPGEILGIAGLAGSGRTTLLRTLFGDIRPTSGRIMLQGKPYHPSAPVDAIASSVYLIPEERARFGLILGSSITENTILSVMRRLVTVFFLRMREGRRLTRTMMRVLGVRARSPQQIVGELSGGNQQKVVLSKALAASSEVLLLDEPTFGVDVGAARDLIQYVRTMTAVDRKAALWVTSDLLELLEVADRIMILRGGTIVRTIKHGDPAFNEPALIAAIQRMRQEQNPRQLLLEGQGA